MLVSDYDTHRQAPHTEGSSLSPRTRTWREDVEGDAGPGRGQSRSESSIELDDDTRYNLLDLDSSLSVCIAAQMPKATLAAVQGD